LVQSTFVVIIEITSTHSCWDGSCNSSSPFLILTSWTGLVGRGGKSPYTPKPKPFFSVIFKDLVPIPRPKALRSHHTSDQYVVLSGWVEKGQERKLLANSRRFPLTRSCLTLRKNSGSKQLTVSNLSPCMLKVCDSSCSAQWKPNCVSERPEVHYRPSLVRRYVGTRDASTASI
jgi:hypothetical protein